MASSTIPQTELTQQVVRLMLEGHSLSDVIEYMQSTQKNLTTQQASEWAFAWFEQAADIPEKSRIGWCIEAYRELYRRMVEIGDFNGAVRCVSEISKLSGGKPAKTTKSANINTDVSWTDQMKKLS